MSQIFFDYLSASPCSWALGTLSFIYHFHVLLMISCVLFVSSQLKFCFYFHFSHPMSIYVSISVCVSLSSHSESQENSVDSPDSTPVGPIPIISVTGVSGERVANGEALRARTEAETLGGTTELGLDPRGQEVRRQKSLRRHVEDGTPSAGRLQF